jgi:hypothetical protein
LAQVHAWDYWISPHVFGAVLRRWEESGSSKLAFDRDATLRLKTTKYFQETRLRPDRAAIKEDWIVAVIRFPEHEQVQADGRIRRWAAIPEMGNRYLRVVLLDDEETVHNAFFDRSFKL